MGQMGRRHDRANPGGRAPTAARSLELMTGLAIAACQVPATAHAQEQSDVQIAVVGGLEEILVTARKREENLQTTPLSVTAFTGEALAQQGIETLVDLGQHVANLSMISGQGGGSTQTQISIRGVGQSDFILTSDQSVGLYLDGVYYPRSIGAALDLIDIERIEVLRGPQGTLYGASSLGGLVKYVTKDPSTTGYSGRVEAGTSDVANGHDRGFIGVVNRGQTVLETDHAE